MFNLLSLSIVKESAKYVSSSYRNIIIYYICFVKRKQIPNPGPSNPLHYMINLSPNANSVAGLNPAGHTNAVDDPVFSDAIVADPQVLWLPLDRISLDLDDRQMLYKVSISIDNLTFTGSSFLLRLYVMPWVPFVCEDMIFSAPEKRP